MIAVASYMSDMYEHLYRCAEHGVNAVTIAEEALYPWNTSPMQTAELDALARRNGVTLTGTGHQDVYWVNLVSMVLATAHRIDTVTGKASWNVDDFGPEVVKRSARRYDRRGLRHVAGRDGTPAELRPQHARRAGRGPRRDGRRAVDARRVPRSRSSRCQCKSLGLTVEPGKVIGFTDVDTVATNEGMTLTFEMTGRLYMEGEADINDWTVTGEPELHLSNPAVPTGMTTVTQLVNRIPDVINAPPGFVTVEKLPDLGTGPTRSACTCTTAAASGPPAGAAVGRAAAYSSGTSPAGARPASARSIARTVRPSSSARSLRATALRTTSPPM